MREKMTIWILSKGEGGTKRFHLPRSLVLAAPYVLGAFAMALSYGIYDYLHIQTEAEELARLRLKTQEQKAQMQALLAKVDHLSVKMEELAQFDKKIRIVANLQKGSEREQLLGVGGPVDRDRQFRERMLADDRSLLEHASEDVDRLAAEASVRHDSFRELLDYLKEQRSILASTPSLWPVKGWVTSEFGHRPSPFGGGREFHRGIDVATRHRARILAPADGMIAEVSYGADIGNSIRIDHGRGVVTQYGHLAQSAVKEGTMVRRGALIGYAGNTGRSTGTHLHYAVYHNGVAVNPRRFLP